MERDCFNEHHNGVIIDPEIATCAHCELSVPIDRANPLDLVDIMLMHLARVHPEHFDSYVAKLSKTFRTNYAEDMTPEGYIESMREKRVWKDTLEGMGFYR